LNLERTITLCNKQWKWRVDNGYEEVPCLNETIDFMRTGCFLSIPGTRTIDGYGIIYWRFKNFIPNKEPFTIESIVKWALWFYTEASFYESMDYYRKGIVIVEDLSDLSKKCIDFKFLKNLANVFQEKFPMNVKKVLLINAPPFFKKLYHFVKFFLKKKISDKFQVLEDEEIFNLIERDQLHQDFGGDLPYSPEEWLDVIKGSIEFQNSISKQNNN